MSPEGRLSPILYVFVGGKSNQIKLFIYLFRNEPLLAVYKTGEPDSKAPDKKR